MFNAIKGGIRVVVKLFGRLSIRGIKRDADAGADGRRIAGRIHLGRKLIDDSACQTTRRIGLLLAWLDDGEFIATKPRNRIVRIDATFEDHGNLAQDAVTVRMAEDIVDGLEAIEVDADEGNLGPFAFSHM